MKLSACTLRSPSLIRTGSAFSAKGMRLLSAVIQAGFFLALSASSTHASERTVVLNYICSTYESARQVALERGWETPDSMPRDCRLLFGEPMEEKLATVVKIIEVLPIDSGQWIEIARICRYLSRHYDADTYSAGIVNHPLVF
jgi:hypothetical protein